MAKSNTPSKTVKTLATFVAEWKAIESSVLDSVRKVEAQAMDRKALLILDMQTTLSLTDVAIANALGITKANVGHFIVRAVAVKHGFDGASTVQATKESGNDVTVARIKKIALSGAKSADVKKQLSDIGLPEKGKAVGNKGNTGKQGKGTTIQTVKVTLERWVSLAEKGKLDKLDLHTWLTEAINSLEG